MIIFNKKIFLYDFNLFVLLSNFYFSLFGVLEHWYFIFKVLG